MSSLKILTEEEVALIASSRDKAHSLYEGNTCGGHRSCGVALAETFGCATQAYQSLRRGGITGKGNCGAIRGGEMVLGEELGDPSPTGSVTPELREAIAWYQEQWPQRLDLGSTNTPNPETGDPNVICNHLTGQFDNFKSAERKTFCTNLAAGAAEITAEALLRFGKSSGEQDEDGTQSAPINKPTNPE